MKKFSIIGISVLLITLSLISCHKKETVQVFSSANIIHASPGTASFQVFVDTMGPINNTTVAYGGSSGYIGLIPGNRNISLENRATTPKSVYAQFSDNMEAGKAYTYVVYDTIDAKGFVKVLRLNDNLTLPTVSSAFVRFLDLAIFGGNMDVTLVRGTQYDTSSTSTQKLVFAPIDSVTISNQSYIGSSPNISALSDFKYSVTGVTGNAIAKSTTLATIPDFYQNNRYIIKLKTAGTQTVLLQSSAVTLLPGRIYTVFARGTAKGQALAVSVVQNY